MKQFQYLKIGIIHSQIGYTDGVSIVIDQSTDALKDLGVKEDNIYYLAGCPFEKSNAYYNRILWHKNEQNKHVLEQYSHTKDKDLKQYIEKNTDIAKRTIQNFIERNNLDLIIIHNNSHTGNFILAVGADKYFEELRQNNKSFPKFVTWWHDSYLEKERLKKPSSLIEKYLDHIPGKNIDGIIFINSTQIEEAKTYLKKFNFKNINNFFKNFITLIPNKCTPTWSCKTKKPLPSAREFHNKGFFEDIGLIKELRKKHLTLKDTVIVLQHSIIIKRKKIEHAIDFVFKLAEKFNKENNKKCICLIIAGSSGDEHDNYKEFIQNYFKELKERNHEQEVLLIFGENYIKGQDQICFANKTYSFADIPSIVAQQNSIGTYFSSIEGYGNNLLEMVGGGLPVIMNKYPVYKKDIKKLGLKLIETETGNITNKHIDQAYEMIINKKKRNKVVKHNINIIKTKCDYKTINKPLKKFLENILNN